MNLADRLRAQVATGGPLTIAQYMTACLFDPHDGYYATRPRLGPEGDFITAPLISQMFGELIGLWAAQTWEALGRPQRVLLVEVGPGDGTLMDDLLRAARVAPGFLAALEPWLVEVSPPLRDLQRQRLGHHDLAPAWATSLEAIPATAPVILVANEVLDCLPARQFVRSAGGWAERVVGLDTQGRLAIGLAASSLPLPQTPAGAVLELSSAQEAFGAEVASLVISQGGAGLLIDYGRAEPGYGDTLQALKAHRKVDPLACPGEADLTVHADFPAVLAAARKAGARTRPILTQAGFLGRLGIGHRAAALAKSRPERSETLSRQFHRLTAAEEMGELFKACVIHSAGLAVPAFEES